MTAATAAWTLMVALLSAVVWVDVRERRIPNALNGALFIGGLAVADLPIGPGLGAALGGAAVGGAFLLAVAVGFRRLRGIDGLGLGDVKFVTAAGAWTGWQGIGPMVLIAAITALAWLAIRRLAGSKHDRDARIAFGPYLGLGLLIVRVGQTSHAGMWEIFSG